MPKYVVLVRAVNVGGTGKMPMKEACTALREAGFGDVRSYIASGNFVLTGDTDEGVTEALSDLVGAPVDVLCFDTETYRAHLATCPVEPEAGNQLHGFFCWDEAKVDWDLVDELKTDTESLTQAGRVLWLHAPDGIGRSKLAEKMPKVTGKVRMTARNLNTLRKLNEMLDG